MTWYSVSCQSFFGFKLETNLSGEMSGQSVGTASFVWSRRETRIVSVPAVSNRSLSQLTCEDELCHCHTETRQEGVEGLQEHQCP